MKINTFLKLGRISNLPTIWTNVLAGISLINGSILDVRVSLLFLSMSAFYIGGMFLNDAFDVKIDAIERPERPIPAGEISQKSVCMIGFLFLILGIISLVNIVNLFPILGFQPILTAIILSVLIVIYNLYHKGNPLSPLIMGMCRICVYLIAAFCFVSSVSTSLLIGVGMLLSYLIGLTYVAKQENLSQLPNMWPICFLLLPLAYLGSLAFSQFILLPFILLLFVVILVALFFIFRHQPSDIPRGVVSLIAGICVLDAILICSAGQVYWACFAIICFFLTLALQKLVPGT